MFFCYFSFSLSGYPPFSDDRSDKPMNEQILNGDYQHYLKEAFWKTISENGVLFGLFEIHSLLKMNYQISIIMV